MESIIKSFKKSFKKSKPKSKKSRPKGKKRTPSVRQSRRGEAVLPRRGTRSRLVWGGNKNDIKLSKPHLYYNFGKRSRSRVAKRYKSRKRRS